MPSRTLRLLGSWTEDFLRKQRNRRCKCQFLTWVKVRNVRLSGLANSIILEGEISFFARWRFCNNTQPYLAQLISIFPVLCLLVTFGNNSTYGSKLWQETRRMGNCSGVSPLHKLGKQQSDLSELHGIDPYLFEQLDTSVLHWVWTSETLMNLSSVAPKWL